MNSGSRSAAAVTARWWQNVGIDPLKVARKLWKETRSTREAKSGEQQPVGTATAASVTTAQTAARAGHPGSDAAAQLENSEANRQ
jgi:hypothetical protein